MPRAKDTPGRESACEPRLGPPVGLEAMLVDGDDQIAILCWPAAGVPARIEGLSAAQHDVLRLMLAGLSNADIAKTRGTSPRTVANQIASIFRNLGVRSRAEVFALVSRRAIHPPERR